MVINNLFDEFWLTGVLSDKLKMTQKPCQNYWIEYKHFETQTSKQPSFETLHMYVNTKQVVSAFESACLIKQLLSQCNYKRY